MQILCIPPNDVLNYPPFQIGACRHGDRCSRKHIKPPFSQTILLPNVYHNPAHDPGCKYNERELQEGFDAVYEDLYWCVSRALIPWSHDDGYCFSFSANLPSSVIC